MDLDVVRRLTTGEGAALLASLPPYDDAAAVGLGVRLREAGFDADLVAAALTQSRLRARAVDKFGPFAAGLLLTADGLEQATRLTVAAAHAHRYRAAGIELVHDLGCGIGADALAIGGLDLAVRAVDSDPVTAAVAAYNLRQLDDAVVTCAAAESVNLPLGAATVGVGVWVDPARRVRGVADATGRTRRVAGLDAISPTWDQVLGWATQVPATGAKLAPSFPHSRVPAGAEAQWTSWNGEVVECAVWFGPLVRTSGRTAAVARSGGPPVVVTEADAEGATGVLTAPARVGPYLYEPDRAVLQAGLTGAVAAPADGVELASGVGYVSAERSVDIPFARRYAVQAVLPLDAKTVRIWLRDHGLGKATIKKRGVSVDPDRFRHQLRLGGGEGTATLVLTRAAGRSVAIVVEPR